MKNTRTTPNFTRLRSRTVGGRVAWVLALGWCATSLAAEDRTLSFNDEVVPILSENCYACHGPDPGMRKADLRLDRREFAVMPHEDSGPAILPGEPDRSPLVHRIESTDEDERMPPLEAHKSLTSDEIALLRRWIKEGAEYQEHWAFIAPERPPLPAVARDDWAENPIDRFVLERLEREGLSPSPPADRRALLRRVTLDLTGLPPTPEELEAFGRDELSDAYERRVNDLLSRASYGEHRARYWLDAARYADTHGLHTDKFRSVWPFRDYVIKAFNENKPFDQFVREQIAGDLYLVEDVDQIVATAFVRLGIANSESGTIEEEQSTILLTERTKAFSGVFLGMTTGCAACHDHKFDPTTQKDFYQLGAFFNNLDEFFHTGQRPDWPPTIVVPPDENRDAYQAVLAQRAVVQRQLEERRAQAQSLIADWIRTGPAPAHTISPKALQLRLRLDEGKGSVLSNSAPGAEISSIVVDGGPPEWGEDTWLWPSFRMSEKSRVRFPGAIGDVGADEAFSISTWLQPRANALAEIRPPLGTIVAKVDATHGSRGWGLYYNSVNKPKASDEVANPDGEEATEPTPEVEKLTSHGKLMLRLVGDTVDEAIIVQTRDIVLTREVPRWSHVVATYDGSRTAAAVRLYVDGVAQELEIVADRLSGEIRTPVPMQLSAEEGETNRLLSTRFQDFRFYQRELTGEEAKHLPRAELVGEILAQDPAEWSEDQFKWVSDYYFAEHDEPTLRAKDRLAVFDVELDALAKGGVVTLVSKESPRLAYAQVLDRGVYSQRIERVRPSVPHFLPPLSPDAPRNRRGLAEWVVRADNPLTARVTVNRWWQQLFGMGLVETTNDFGLVGARPSNRPLLDWLAVDFRESGWDVKRFYKQLVMSATYRQSARITPELLERDPDNRLLARGPRFRMDAEMVRDAALAASGLLVTKIGGPSAKPYQPAGLWEALTYPESDAFKPDKYVRADGDGLYRRSVYTFTKRQALIPNMEILDQPNRDESCTRRPRANTPLQALVLMNDPQWLEAARRLAERVMVHADSPVARLELLGELVVSRPWTARERAVFTESLQKYQTLYADDEAAAVELIEHGESEPSPALAATELAPWMLVASTALNLDETLNK